MEKEAKYFIVGIFVTAVLAAILAFTIWIAGSHDHRNYERYTVYFTDPVSGLKEGASVQYKGVEVGKTLNIRLSPERKDLIKVDIEVEENTPIRAGTNASLAMLGITGLVYMELTTELTDTEAVPYIEGEEYPVIQGNGTRLAKLLQDIPKITENVLGMTERLNMFMGDENMLTLVQILKNMESMARDMNGLLSPENVSNTSTMLKNFSTSSEGIQALIEKLEKTTAEIDAAVRAISDVVTRNEASVNRFAQDGLDQITQMSIETQKMAESIRKVAENLNQDPSQLIYQPPRQGVEIAK